MKDLQHIQRGILRNMSNSRNWLIATVKYPDGNFEIKYTYEIKTPKRQDLEDFRESVEGLLTAIGLENDSSVESLFENGQFQGLLIVIDDPALVKNFLTTKSKGLESIKAVINSYQEQRANNPAQAVERLDAFTALMVDETPTTYHITNRIVVREGASPRDQIDWADGHKASMNGHSSRTR
jgi:hypothetical protein